MLEGATVTRADFVLHYVFLKRPAQFGTALNFRKKLWTKY
jgi:hypothetical protein